MAPIVEQGGADLIGVIQIINNKAGVPFGTLTEEGVAELAQTLAIAFKQRQKPQMVKTKYDYLISDAVLSAGEFELASRQARKKAVDIETVLIDEFQVKIPAIGAALSKFFGVPYEPFKADRIKPMDLLKNLKREYVESNQWLPIDEAKEGLSSCAWIRSGSAVRASPRTCSRSRKLIYKVTTQKEFKETVNQFYGAEAVDTGDIGDMLSGLGTMSRRGDGRLRRRRCIGRGRQRTGEARQQDHHRRLQPGRVGHPHRALPRQGEDRDPLPQGRRPAGPTSRCRPATAARSWRA